MRLLLLRVVLLLGAATPAIHAQTRPPCHVLPNFGADPYAMTVSEALDAALAFQFNGWGTSEALARAARSGDASLIPRLKEAVEVFWCDAAMSYQAMQAIWTLGEPEDYFLGYMRDYERDDWLSYYAIFTLARAPHADLLPELDAIAAQDLPRGASLSDAVRAYRSNLEWQEDLPATSIAERVQELLYGGIEFALMGAEADLAADTLRIDEGWSDGFLAAHSVFARDHLALLAQEYPTAVREGIDAYELRFKPGVDPDSARVYEEGFRAHALRFAFPPGYVQPPEAPAGTDIRPLLNCVEDNGDGTLTAFFAYGNLAGAPFTVSYGVNNQVAQAPLQGEQPEVFVTVGRTPPYPGSAWRVRFPSSGHVTWRLLGRSKRADASSPRCPAN